MILLKIILIALICALSLLSLLMNLFVIGHRISYVKRDFYFAILLSALGALTFGYFGFGLFLLPFLIKLGFHALIKALERVNRGFCLRLVWLKNASLQRQLIQAQEFLVMKQMEGIPETMEIILPFWIGRLFIRFLEKKQGALSQKYQILQHPSNKKLLSKVLSIQSLKKNDKLSLVIQMGKLSVMRV